MSQPRPTRFSHRPGQHDLQVALHDQGGLIGYVDMLWPRLGVVGEGDGLITYGADAQPSSRRRWTCDDLIMRTPSAVAERIRRAAQWSTRRAG